MSTASNCFLMVTTSSDVRFSSSARALSPFTSSSCRQLTCPQSSADWNTAFPQQWSQ